MKGKKKRRIENKSCYSINLYFHFLFRKANLKYTNSTNGINVRSYKYNTITVCRVTFNVIICLMINTICNADHVYINVKKKKEKGEEHVLSRINEKDKKLYCKLRKNFEGGKKGKRDFFIYLFDSPKE